MDEDKIVIVPPAIESLLRPGYEDDLWPRRLKQDKSVCLETSVRRNLYSSLDSLFKKIPPTMEVTEAYDLGLIEQIRLADIYKSLALFITSDKHHYRLILYLPFELLPNKSWVNELPEGLLHNILQQFISSYMLCWHGLLDQNDVRTNFFNGDILEPELAPNGQLMVRKAAHLVPILIARGYISENQVLRMMETSDDILRISLSDGISTLEKNVADLKINNSDDQNMDGSTWLKELDTNIEFEIRKIEMRTALDLLREIPEARVRWESQDRKSKLIEKCADRIAKMIIDGSLTIEQTNQFLKSSGNCLSRIAVILGAGKAVETTARNNMSKARQILFAHEDNISAQLRLNRSESIDIISSTLWKLTNLGVIDETYLYRFGIKLPRLDNTVSDINLIEKEIKDIEPSINLIGKDSDISALIYPVIIFFGSRLKGYAGEKADLDIAVFVRPGVDISRRPEIQQKLSKIFTQTRIDRKIVEFWLEEDGGNLSIRDFPDPDVTLADSSWIHLLFAGVWIGRKNIVRDFFKKLLPGFIYSKDKKIVGRDARSTWLAELEREVLQYRLMHKGYKRVYPTHGNIATNYPESLDSESTFWDSGYRRLATKLFITKVFLPQLDKK